MFPCKVYGLIHVPRYAIELFFIVVDNFFCLCPAYAQVIGKAECALSVDDAKVYAFCFVTHFFRHIFFFDIINLCCGGSVNVFAIPERIAHIRIAADAATMRNSICE